MAEQYLDRKWRTELNKLLAGTDVSQIVSRLGITVFELCSWLNGTSFPNLDQLDVVCDHYGVPPKRFRKRL